MRQDNKLDNLRLQGGDEPVHRMDRFQAKDEDRVSQRNPRV
jgi:hypothetical protein